jgi:hypothetical protein
VNSFWTWVDAIDFLLEPQSAKREAISLAPRLQPGGKAPQNKSSNRFERFLDSFKTKNR